MSDIQEYPSPQARQIQQQVQQRHLLALMGIEPWIATNAPTINIASVEMPTSAEPPALIRLQASAVADIEPTLPLSAISAMPSKLNTDERAQHLSVPTHNSPVQDDINKQITADDIANSEVFNSEASHSEQVIPQSLNNIPQITAVQRHRQQRHILAMMGIEQWVQSTSPTLNIADIETVNLHEPALLPQAMPDNVAADVTLYTANHLTATDLTTTDLTTTDLTAANLISATNSDSSTQSSHSNLSLNEAAQPWSDTTHLPPRDKQARGAQEQPVIEDVDLISEDGTLSAPINNTPILDKVAPFDLQGGRYGNWILLVDIHALNHDSQTLWQNISQALSLTCETLSFPICRGEDAPYVANASLAGYIFRLSGMSETLQIAALTALPEGLMHPNLIRMPTLSDMLADSQLKRQLWQQLADS